MTKLEWEKARAEARKTAFEWHKQSMTENASPPDLYKLWDYLQDKNIGERARFSALYNLGYYAGKRDAAESRKEAEGLKEVDSPEVDMILRIYRGTNESSIPADGLAELCTYNPPKLTVANDALIHILTPDGYERALNQVLELAYGYEERGFVNGFKLGAALAGELGMKI